MRHLFAAAVFAAIFSPAVVCAQTADEIVQKHIVAIGGAENWKKVASMRVKGKVKGDGFEVPITITTVHKKGQKVEFTEEGKTGYEIITPTGGWIYNPNMEKAAPEAIPLEVIKESLDELDIAGPLVDYKSKGTKVAYAGKEKVEGKDCYKLNVTAAGGHEEIMYFDAQTYYHVRSVERVTEGDKTEDAVSRFSNYKKLPEGIVYPMHIESDGGPIDIISVEINKPVSESTFQPKLSKQ